MSQYIPKRIKTCLHKNLNTNVYGGIVHNSQKVETAQTDEWMNKM